MADLTDKEIMFLCDPDNGSGHESSRIVSMAREVQRHRSAIAADKERMRAVVSGAAFGALSGDGAPEMSVDDAHRLANLIADRVAEQLAIPAIGVIK